MKPTMKSGPAMKSCCLVFSTLLIVVFEANAAIPVPAISFTWPGTSPPPGGPVTDGWTFRTSVPISVTSLGVYDAGGDGFAESHPVAIWTSAGAQLASVTVSNASPLAASWFRYVSITPVMLAPGAYVIGDFRSNGTDGVATGVGGFSTAPEITFGYAVYKFAPSLAMPTDLAAYNPSAFGPNFLFVPEPATLTLLALGGLLLARRRAPTS